MTNGTLHLRGAGFETLGHLGVKPFGDAVYDIGAVDCHFNGFPEKLITFDVRGYADRHENIGNPLLQTALAGLSVRSDARFIGFYSVDSLFKFFKSERLYKVVIRTRVQSRLSVLLACDAADRHDFTTVFIHLFQYGKTVFYGHKHIYDHSVGLQLIKFIYGVLPVCRRAYDFVI